MDRAIVIHQSREERLVPAAYVNLVVNPHLQCA